MGDLSEFRGVLVSGTIIGIYLLLTASIPTSLYVSAEDARQIEVPDYFTMQQMYFFSKTDFVRMGGNIPGEVRVELDDGGGGGTFGDWDIDFIYYTPTSVMIYLACIHMHTEWFGIYADDHVMEWRSPAGQDRGEWVSESELNEDMEDGQARYTVACGHTEIHAIVGYNTTKYVSVYDAWNHEDLCVYFGVTFDNENTGFNAMNLLSSILFFDMPDVHWSVNGIIALPLYLSIGYITVIFILKAIEALPFT